MEGHPSNPNWSSRIEVDHVEKDEVNSPPHYNSHPAKVECIDVVEHFNFNIGNAVKYLWRAGLKDDALTDLQKAQWYINREIDRRTING